MLGEGRDRLKDFKELDVWRKAHEATLSLYQLTQQFPREELFGLTSQIRRAASSIGGNLAEGCGRRSDGEFVRFLNIARGSAVELEYHLLLARDVQLLSVGAFATFERQLDEIQRMLTTLAQRVRPIRRGVQEQKVKTKWQTRGSWLVARSRRSNLSPSPASC